MLHGMQTAEAPASTQPSRSFAGILAALASPAQQPASALPGWIDDGLADDVAVLSYEHALRAHARYKPVASAAANGPAQMSAVPAGSSAAIEDEISPLVFEEIAEPASEAAPHAENEAVAAASSLVPDTGQRPCAAPARRLKCASVTVRLSEEECAQLRARAAESGLTVSAYLRSCTFEAEILRAQVKEALAELRSVAVRGRAAAQATPRSRLRISAFFARFWPRFAAAGRAASA